MKSHFVPLLALLALPLSARAEIDFAREIRPIFSEHCFACHGPDANKRKGKLRLDEKESAFAPAKSGETAIVPGDVEIAFNAKYLLDVLNVLEEDGLHLELSEPLKPGVIRPIPNRTSEEQVELPESDYLCVLMPMQIV